jgi:outer membrane immunogenic protein
MKKQLLLGVALGALAVATSAMAADLPVKAPVYKAPVAAVYNWTGWYAGGNIGYSWGHGDADYTEPGFAGSGLPTTLSGSQRIDGIIGGVQIGYNWQNDNKWVFGPYTLSHTQEAKIRWFGTVRARAGVLLNPTLLLYGTGGLAYGGINASGTLTDSFCTPACSWSYGNSTTKFGWTLGAGIEGAIPNTRDWTWKLEYLYIDFGSVSGTGFDTDFGSAFSWSTKVTDNILRIGVNYRFH